MVRVTNTPTNMCVTIIITNDATNSELKLNNYTLQNHLILRTQMLISGKHKTMELHYSLILISTCLLLSLITLAVSATGPHMPSPNTPSDNQQAQFLGAHNAARASLGVGLKPLVWDPKLALFAQSYANVRKDDCAMRHSSDMRYGENLFWGSGSQWAPAQAVGFWFAENQWYRYKDMSCAEGKMCGHYTQIVWRTTQRLGCAKVVCEDGKGVFINCNYDPPGNFVGERPY